MKITSWNVNGIRAIVKKDFFNNLNLIDPDIICLQETKANDHQVSEALGSLNGQYLFLNSAERPGYSGTAVISKVSPLSISKGINIKEFDNEGRVLCLEFEKFFLINVYVPNSGSELARLDYRQEWDKAFFAYLKDLERVKPLIICGDLNVAHRDIDLARPKANYNKTAGYMQEEIDGIERLIGGGFIDTFRHLYPDKTEKYTWWSFRAGARPRNIGWRIDYFLVSESCLPQVKGAFILDEIGGSDHCPVGIVLSQ